MGLNYEVLSCIAYYSKGKRGELLHDINKISKRGRRRGEREDKEVHNLKISNANKEAKKDK